MRAGKEDEMDDWKGILAPRVARVHTKPYRIREAWVMGTVV